MPCVLQLSPKLSGPTVGGSPNPKPLRLGTSRHDVLLLLHHALHGFLGLAMASNSYHGSGSFRPSQATAQGLWMCGGRDVGIPVVGSNRFFRFL